MSYKTRVKDLAEQLKLQPKDLLGVAKELNIPAKASNSVLADEEVARIKERISNGAQPEKRDGADVIVRRRRTKDSAPQAADDTPAAKNEAVNGDAAAENEPKGKKPETKKAKAPEVSQNARIVQPVAAKPEKQPVKETAKVVAEAQEQKPAYKNEKPVEAAAPKETPARKVEAAHPNLSAEPEKDSSGATVSSAPATDGNARIIAKPAPQEEAAPSAGVRVISRPTEQTDARPANRERAQNSSADGGNRGYTDNRAPRSGDARPGGNRFNNSPRPGGNTGGAPRPNSPARPGGNTGGAPRHAQGAAPSPVPSPSDADSRNKKRQKGKRTVEFGDNNDRRFKGDDDGWMRQPRRGKGRKGKLEKASTAAPLKAAKRKIRMEEFIRVADLAHQMGLKAGEIIKILFNLGVMATINQSLDFDTATLVAAEFEYEVEKVGFSEDEFIAEQVDDDPSKLTTRPPVVTIMGHVDHGKTSLLDAIRKTSVTSGEAGGITQHIGAYHVRTKKGDIVFLDTPGHEAFTAMRARGAEVTDIVVLVVAADDGVMEQTREAINHAKAAGVPIMVAVNKMDKESANPDRVKRELAEVGMVAEDWGGDVTFSYVSAKTREGLDDFLELLALQAEILELKANPDKSARGHVVEAKLDKGRGSLGTVLIQQGTLRVGESFVCGVHHGRVRAMFDDQGRKVTSAGPSMPVEVQGFEGVPEAGEEFVCIADEKTARRIAEARATKQRERELAKESKVTLETFLSRRADATEAMVLNLVVKADVQGSLEAIQDQLKKLSNEKVRIVVVHSGAGAISESDVLLAAASDAIIIGFNVRPNPKTKELAETEKVDIRFYDIIYKLVEEIHSAMEGLLAPVEKEVFLGTADVRETFSVPKIGLIAGCHVADGKITRNAQVRLLRDGVVVFTGKIASLKRFKDDAKEVLKGYECGIGIENYNDIKIGDVIEAFEIIEEAAHL